MITHFSHDPTTLYGFCYHSISHSEQTAELLTCSRRPTAYHYVILAHEDAFAICKILDCGVSSGNIFILYNEKTPKDKHDDEGPLMPAVQVKQFTSKPSVSELVELIIYDIWHSEMPS
ncbi:uncharacterized protein ARMOST_19257 [Armillaria ostoyae]|uniref:Uncharacterized protein n=1 Tax=Armillaria ostoyae TaxID=47428 RepID=A0A284S411_ARMOS|nr:uncharacterized protein ARMOST_19257 [Armillaria ostoyae]